MVKVVRRVRELVDLLAERGFTPLAAAILQGLDQGVLLPDERPVEVRRGLGRPSHLYEPERVWLPETREEQAKFVAGIVVDQLIEPLRMRERSANLLSGIMDGEVIVGTINPEGDFRPFDRGAAADLVGGREELFEALRMWLGAEDGDEVS